MTVQFSAHCSLGADFRDQMFPAARHRPRQPDPSSAAAPTAGHPQDMRGEAVQGVKAYWTIFTIHGLLAMAAAVGLVLYEM